MLPDADHNADQIAVSYQTFHRLPGRSKQIRHRQKPDGGLEVAADSFIIPENASWVTE